MTKELIYKDIIRTLNYIEIVIDNPKHFTNIRKQLLDIANEVLRLEVGSDVDVK